MIRPLLVLTAVLALTACAGPGQGINRYLLPPAGEMNVAPRSGSLLLLEPIEIAPYLEAEGLLLQIDEITLNQARQHRWADPLRHQLERGLRQRLGARLPDTHILQDEPVASGTQPMRLQVRVDRFLGHYAGYALTSGLWQLWSAKGELLVSRRFQVETPLQADGYPALVKALGNGWNEVAAQISSAVQPLVAATPEKSTATPDTTAAQPE
ncbi:membrane integrity-associated transporter subunit PqiC [Motiliproteus sp. SC1-56]|uniref:PqiC family protein n=1 Tax=Motiliproteus sp. SC1-56 TaxID=2799565 RepID=UPI001F5D465B|nr:ABC-type transport auxiliary lipoprotein family protein [Motiliproteus sp. SC1-56]